MPKTNRYLEAFKESYNAVGLASAIAVSAALLNPLPLIGALVAEAVYLLFVPDSKWYEARLSERYDNEVIKRREALKQQLFPSLSTDVQMRFARLEACRNQINSETFQGHKWFREVLRKLDYLLEKFLLFAQKEVQFDQYLQSVLEEVSGAPAPQRVPQRARVRGESPLSLLQAHDEWVKRSIDGIRASYDRDIEEIETMLTSSENLHNQAVLDKRKEVITRRKEYISKIGETLINLSHQLQLMEDTFGLINDEVRARSPEQVLADIDDVVNQTDNLTEILQDVAPFATMPVAKGASKLYDVPEETK